MNKRLLTAIAAICTLGGSLFAQPKLYHNSFALQDVKLLDSPFKRACELNLNTLKQYDTDRLLAPYLKEAGLTPKAPSFPNWDGLDGHVGGHYLSALAIHLAATGDSECRQRMEYMLDELERCQKANGNGYVGGVPDGKRAWQEIAKGNVGIVWKYWVPWYNLHKTYTGLRDAWLYGGSKKARKMFLSLCDWGLTVIEALDDKQMEKMLDCEFGGMDEVYADAYDMTGDTRYLDAAKRFSHRWLLDSMAKGKDNLDNKHANTQVPKVVGYQRIAELSIRAGRTADAELYERAARFFWQTVTERRSLALGGNSRREHFAPANDCISYVDDREGPESCNTNNMLKLTEGLFRMAPDAQLADFYERATLNHILSTQHPVHGGYVYFTPARPAHYRVYSAPNSAMWCCVGTGMENHGKYGEFIYTHSGDSLFVNLFTASELNWKERGIRLVQETRFPDEESVRLTVHTKKTRHMTLLVRHPQWCARGAMKAVCKGTDHAAGSEPSSYVAIERDWKDGDVIELTLPMQVRVEELPNVPQYIAIMRGPVLLAADMGSEGLDGIVADDSRWGHIAHGKLVSLFDTPILTGSRADITAKLQNMKPVPGKPMCFTVPELFGGRFAGLQLQPFFRLHDCRYMMYWLTMTPEEYAERTEAEKQKEARKLLLDSRTVDMVTPGEQQPEADHYMKNEDSHTGNLNGAAWRDARNGGFFEYRMKTGGNDRLTLMVRYWGNEQDKNLKRNFTILIDGKELRRESIGGRWNRKDFVDMEYPISAEMLAGKQTITVTFRSDKGCVAGGIFAVRLLKCQTPQTFNFDGNPLIRNNFTADPAPLVTNGRLYLYVGHDEYYAGQDTAHGGREFNMTEWLCYSTDDMHTWTDHGAVMRPTDFAWAEGEAWASQVVERDGHYYFYTTVQAGGEYRGKAVGVAVADSPTGPFVDAIGKPLVHDRMTDNGARGWWNDIDPTVLVDDDGSAWLCWGNGTCFMAKLKKNMTELDGDIKVVDLPDYVEGPWLHKRNGLYYLTYASQTNNQEDISYATARHPQGPWTYRGRLTGHAINSFTIHPGIAEYKGKWYLFHHNATLTLEGHKGATGRRSVCVDELHYNADGTLVPVF